MASETEINDITEKVKEFAEISKNIKIIQEKLKILNKKKKELYKEVIPKLKTSNVTKCNLSFGTLKVVNTQRKIAPTKVSIKDKLVLCFNTRATEHDFISGTPETKSEIIFKYIYIDNLELKEQSNLTMTYNKEFKEQLKSF